ncbi:MAG TPA: NAD(P)H-dependent oxidoreductase subunit E [Mariprofundaceae bacterium]|nr:NAD(P)H-dependent oxidoreductase subunit E [Mariprofundaceae bacterium]
MSAEPQMQPRFSDARLEEIKALAAKYPQPRSALLPVLHMAQQDFGYLSMEVQQMVAEVLDVRLMQVREVVTFYTMFREQPCGKHLLEVCTNASCMLNGANALVRHLCDSLGIRLGETTPDGLFTVTEVECLGACGGAPVVQIDGLFHEKVDAAHLDEVIRQGRTEGGAA